MSCFLYAVTALALAEMLATDGWFKFTVPDDSVTAAKTAAGLKATGKATVNSNGGNRGEIAAALDFDERGKLTAVQQAIDRIWQRILDQEAM